MEKLKNLCGQIPEELHNKVRTEQESLGLTLGKYLEQVLTAHFAAPAPAVRGGDRTLAFQVPEVLFQRVKQYLEAHKPLSQKAFVVGLLENALIKWERGEEISSGMNTIGKGEKERTLAVVVPCELFERVKREGRSRLHVAEGFCPWLDRAGSKRMGKPAGCGARCGNSAGRNR